MSAVTSLWPNRPVNLIKMLLIWLTLERPLDQFSTSIYPGLKMVLVCMFIICKADWIRLSWADLLQWTQDFGLIGGLGRIHHHDPVGHWWRDIWAIEGMTCKKYSHLCLKPGSNLTCLLIGFEKPTRSQSGSDPELPSWIRVLLVDQSGIRRVGRGLGSRVNTQLHVLNQSPINSLMRLDMSEMTRPNPELPSSGPAELVD